jgi:D-lactate dehydrogenase
MASTRTQVSFFALERDAESFLSERLPSARLSSYSGGLSPAMLRRHADATVLAPFINSPVNAKVLDALPKLRLVSCMSTGFDHVDLEECRKRGIAVCNVPSYGENTVAEHTFALILNLSRKVHLAFERTVRGNFSTAGLMGFDLKGKTIGIIGAGKIGYHVARIARGFEMDILVSNPTVRPEWKKEFGARFVGLDELLKRSDVVTIHCPLNDATRHLINQKNIRLMKRDAVLINTARGPIVDTVALALALDRKWCSIKKIMLPK